MQINVVSPRLRESGLFSWPSLLENEIQLQENENFTGPAISEDDQNIYVEATLPGVEPQNIEVTYDKGMLWIHGEIKEEEEDIKRQYYRQVSRSYSYRTVVPSAVDETKEPQVLNKNGIIKVTFKKVAKTNPKKLPVQTE